MRSDPQALGVGSSMKEAGLSERHFPRDLRAAFKAKPGLLGIAMPGHGVWPEGSLHAWADLGAIMDVGAWLRRLGLERYEAAFRDNEIDAAVLPSLTAEDLKDLGIGIVGHRRKLLDAIAALRADVSAKPAPPDPLPATDRTAKDTAERRQVTVMFSDLVGSNRH
jgi:SAM domain (Sterile alpha motif)